MTKLVWPPAEAPLRARSFFDSSATLAAMRIGGAGVGFLTQILLARVLGASDLGIFYSATSLATVGGYFTSLGYSQIASRFAGRYREPAKARFFAAFVTRAALDGLLAGCAAAAVIAALALWLPGIAPQARICYALGGGMMIAATLLAVFSNLAGAMRMFGWCYVPECIVRPAAFLVLALLLAWLGTPTAVQITFVFGLLNALTAVVVVTVMLKVLPPLSWPRHASRRLANRWRREAGALVLLSLYINSFADIGILFATPFLSSADVALFGVCLKLSLLIGYAIQVSQQRCVPDLADAHRQRDAAAKRKIVRRSLPFPVLLTLAGFAACALVGDRLLALLGASFARGRMILLVMVACQVARAVAGPSSHMLTLRGAQKTSAALCVIALVVLFAADAILAPMFGSLGAAIAAFISYTSWLAGNAAALAYFGEPPTDIFSMLLSAAGAGAKEAIRPPRPAESA